MMHSQKNIKVMKMLDLRSSMLHYCSPNVWTFLVHVIWFVAQFCVQQCVCFRAVKGWQPIILPKDGLALLLW